jgi:hypothetical protein
MRTRRHFQPALDSMPIRIAPSTVVSPAHVTTVIISTSVSPTLTMHAQDTNMPETGSSTPVTPTPTPTKAG